MKYYSAIKRNELLTYTTTWMNLKSIDLSKRSQIQSPAQWHRPVIQTTLVAEAEKSQIEGSSGQPRKSINK